MRRVFLLFIFAIVAARSWADNDPIDRATCYRTLIGQWEGTLEYRDYQPPHKRVTLPTVLVAEPSYDENSVVLHFAYVDGPSKTVQSSKRFTLDEGKRRVTWSDEDGPAKPSDVFSIASYSDSDDTLILLGRGWDEDEDKDTRIRYTMQISLNELRILEETTSDGPEFAFRHLYVLKRIK